MFVDPSGQILETILDVAGLIWSAVDMIMDPSWANFGFLLWDAASVFIPFVPGSYAGKFTKLGVKAAGKIDDVADAAKAINRVDDVLDAGKALNKADDIADVGKTLTKQSDNYSDDFMKWLNKGDADNVVYHAINKDGKEVYTGITKQNIEKRLYQHKRAGKEFKKLDPIHKNLTRNQAKALEQYGIKNGPANLFNIRNSISPESRFYDEAMRWAGNY